MLRVGSVLFFLGFISILNAELPSYVTKCKRSDPNLNVCLTKQANIALAQLLKGDTSVGIKSLRAVLFPTIYVKPTNQDDFALEFKNSLVYGLDSAYFEDISIDFKKQKLQMKVIGTHWQWEGAYNAFGQLNNSSYDHKGTLNITFGNTTEYFDAEYEPINIDGSFYMQLKNEIFSFNVEKIVYNLNSEDPRYSEEAHDLMANFNGKNSILNIEFLATVKVLIANAIASISNSILRSEPICNLFDD